MRGQDQLLIPMEEGSSMNAMLEVAWHIVRTVVKHIDRFVILCRSSDSTGQLFAFSFFYHKATFVRQGMGGSTDMGRLCYIDIR